MDASCVSLMGGKKATSVVAIGVLLAVVMGLSHAVQEADAAALAVINLSSTPVKVAAVVNGSILGSVVAAVNAEVTLPLANVSVDALVNLIFTNLLNNATASALIPVTAATTAIRILPTLLGNTVTIALGSLVGGLFSLLTLLVTSL